MTGPASALAGHDVTCTVRVKNSGPSDAPSVVVTVALPAGTALLSQTQTLGPPFTLGGTPALVTDTIASLAAGLRFVARVASTVAPATVLACSSRAATSAADPTPTAGNDAASLLTTVAAVLPPQIGKAFAPSSIPLLGGRSNLTLTVSIPTDKTDTLPGVALSGASLTAGTACAVSVDIPVDVAGGHDLPEVRADRRDDVRPLGRAPLEPHRDDDRLPHPGRRARGRRPRAERQGRRPGRARLRRRGPEHPGARLSRAPAALRPAPPGGPGRPRAPGTFQLGAVRTEGGDLEAERLLSPVQGVDHRQAIV